MVIDKKKNNKRIVVIFVIVLLIFLITILLVKANNRKKEIEFMKQEQQRVKQYTALTDFKTIQEVCLYLDCVFEKQEVLENGDVNYNIYITIPIGPYSNENSNRTYYEKLIQYTAYVLEYKGFNIIDTKNNITIKVYCNEDDKVVEKYYINSIENYFDVEDSKIEANKFETIQNIQVNVNSEIVTQLIQNNWKIDNINFGTTETTYRSYDIYFDEGIELRKIDGKVFNIIFNEKYTMPIINNLYTTSTIEEIEQVLGEPQFQSAKLIGYKTEKFYIFFYNNQVSIYRIDKYETEKVAEIIGKYKSTKEIEKFINTIKDEWKDYDKYEYNTNYVLLQYSLKGITFRYDTTTKKGITLYNNYSGKACGNNTLEDYITGKENVPSNIYIDNNDLVFLAEIDRVNRLDDATATYNYETIATLNISSKFRIITEKLETSNSYKIRVISINNEYPHVELKQAISNGIWFDDYNFIYSVKGMGIYCYNAKTRQYTTIVSGNEDFIIKKVEDNLLYYDETSVAVSVN